MLSRAGFIAICLVLSASVAEAARIKDLADVEGVRENQLIGYGLVIGLNGTGDKDSTKFTTQSLTSMLSRMGIRADPEKVKVKNVAAVVVTAISRRLRDPAAELTRWFPPSGTRNRSKAGPSS